jgi:hypothetical protein
MLSRYVDICFTSILSTSANKCNRVRRPLLLRLSASSPLPVLLLLSSKGTQAQAVPHLVRLTTLSSDGACLMMMMIMTIQ